MDALPALRHAFGVYIKRVGTALVSDPERERVMVAELLAMKAKLDAVMAAAFNGKELFGNTLKVGGAGERGGGCVESGGG